MHLPGAGRGRPDTPTLPRPRPMCRLLERDVDVRRVLGDVGDEGGTARAVVVTRTPEDSDRQVVQLPVRHEALQSQRTLRELELDVAEGLAAAEGADPAIEAGVITGDL